MQQFSRWTGIVFFESLLTYTTMSVDCLTSVCVDYAGGSRLVPFLLARLFWKEHWGQAGRMMLATITDAFPTPALPVP
jgi:hypothetical protein